MGRLEGLNERAMRAAVLGIMLALVPAVAWGQTYTNSRGEPDENANEWKADIDAAIRGGASDFVICTKAMSSANNARSLAFKDWAYGIANQYCNKADDPASGDGDKPSAPPAAPIPERPQVVNGITVPLCSHGMPCLGRLRQAMGLSH